MESLKAAYDEAIAYGFQLKDEYVQNALDPNKYNDTNDNDTNDNDNKDKSNHKKSLQIPKETFTSIKKKLLEIDLRQHMKPFFPLEINSSTDGIELKGPVVLQIVSIGNITQPLRRRDENTQPRLLAIQLSDGTTKVTGIEIEALSDINANTPPGGKILYLGGIIRFGKLLLTPNNFKYIGGVVDHLLEAYQANKIAQKLRSIGIQNFRGIEGPPQFEIKLLTTKASGGSKPKASSTSESSQGQQKEINYKADNKKGNDKIVKKKGTDSNLDLPTPPPTPIPVQHIKYETNNNETRIKDKSNKNDGGYDRRQDRHESGRGRHDKGRGGRERGRDGQDRRGRGRGRGRHEGGNDYIYNANTASSQSIEPVSFLENDFPTLSIKLRTWSCVQCTFANHEALTTCEMCNKSR